MFDYQKKRLEAGKAYRKKCARGLRNAQYKSEPTPKEKRQMKDLERKARAAKHGRRIEGY